MVGPIVWIDGWVGPSRPPWRGEVEEIVSHSTPSRNALQRAGAQLAARARGNLAMTSSRQGKHESFGTLSIHTDQPGLDVGVHLQAVSRQAGTSGAELAQAIEFGHDYHQERRTLSGALLERGSIEGLRILTNAADSMISNRRIFRE